MKLLRAGRHTIDLSKRTLVMGILNVTPDSFSDGGDYVSFGEAMKQAETMIEAGADIIDIGGESSRPGSQPISAAEEIARIVPVIAEITRVYPDIPISVDTWKHEVAQAALEAGASIINDIYGLHADKDLASVISKHEAAVILMHNAVMYRDEQAAVQHFSSAFRMKSEQAERYRKLDLWSSVICQLQDSVDLAIKAGIKRDQIVIDPGIGFGLDSGESWELIRNSSKLKVIDLPILLAHSRKRFIGDLLDLPVTGRDQATAVITAACVAGGADIVRVHDITSNRQAALIANKLWGADSSSLLSDSKYHAEGRRAGKAVSSLINMKGMVFHGHTGVLLEEKKLGQRFVIDVTMELRDNKASYSDLLEDSVSYADVFELIRGIMSDRRFDLIEKLAGFIADAIIQNWQMIRSVEVCVSKPQAPIDGCFETMQVCVRRDALV